MRKIMRKENFQCKHIFLSHIAVLLLSLALGYLFEALVPLIALIFHIFSLFVLVHFFKKRNELKRRLYTGVDDKKVKGTNPFIVFISFILLLALVNGPINHKLYKLAIVSSKTITVKNHRVNYSNSEAVLFESIKISNSFYNTGILYSKHGVDVGRDMWYTVDKEHIYGNWYKVYLELDP